MREMLVQPAKASLRVEPVNQHADVRGAECRPGGQPLMDATGTHSGTPGGKWCMPLRSATSSSSVFRGYRFAANSVMPETNEVSSISRRARITSKGMLFSFHTFKRISTLFSRHFAISSRPHDSLGAFGAKSINISVSSLRSQGADGGSSRSLSSIKGPVEISMYAVRLCESGDRPKHRCCYQYSSRLALARAASAAL